MMRLATIAAVSALTACSSAAVEPDEDAARETAESALEGTTYEDQGAPYGCTDDCSGHNAGYQWAQDNRVTDASECGGNSQSFVEGCRAYAEAYEQARTEALEDQEVE